MDEPGVRRVLEKMAAADPPPQRVSVELARRRGRARLRWRRASLAGTPVLAAGAVAAIVVTMSAGGSSAGGPVAGATGTAGPPGAASAPVSASPSASGGPLPAAPRRFSPLIRYVSWGWLPAGQALVSGQTSARHMYLTAGPGPGHASWAVDVYAGGQCHRSRAVLTCVDGGGQISGALHPGPLVDGRPAFWARGYLTWQYARGGWAWLGRPSRHKVPDRSDAVRVAGTIRFGAAPAPGLAWAAQLTGLPGDWQVAATYFTPQSGKLLVSQFYLRVAGKQRGGPAFTVSPATGRSSCSFYPAGQSVRQVIGGHRVTVNHFTAVRGNPPVQQVCAAHDEQLFLFISEAGARPALSAVALFRDHLRLLGADPANWASSPAG